MNTIQDLRDGVLRQIEQSVLTQVESSLLSTVKQALRSQGIQLPEGAGKGVLSALYDIIKSSSQQRDPKSAILSAAAIQGIHLVDGVLLGDNDNDGVPNILDDNDVAGQLANKAVGGIIGKLHNINKLPAEQPGIPVEQPPVESEPTPGIVSDPAGELPVIDASPASEENPDGETESIAPDQVEKPKRSSKAANVRTTSPR